MASKPGTYNLLHANEIELKSKAVHESEHSDEIQLVVEATRLPTPGPTRKATLMSCYFNITSTILGSGILGVPYAFSRMGYVGGLVMLTFCAVLSTFGLHILACCTLRTRHPSSYYEVASQSFPKLSWLIDLAVFIKCYGVATSYLIVVGDLMPSAMTVLHSSEVGQNRSLWVVLAFAVVCVLATLRNLDSLKWTSGMSVGFIFVLVIIVVLFAIPGSGLDPCQTSGVDALQPYQCSGATAVLPQDSQSLKAVSVFFYAYTCHQNTFPVVNELIDPTPRRLNIVFISSVGTVLCLYVIVSICAYSIYGDNLASNLLISFPANYATSVVRILESMIVVLHYPLQLFPARKSALTLVRFFLDDASVEVAPAVSARREAVIIVLFLLTSFSVAMSVDDLGLVLALVGATGSLMVSYILPGMFYYAMHSPESLLQHSSGEGGGGGGGGEEEAADSSTASSPPPSSIKRQLAGALCVFGTIMIPCCLAIIFSQ